MWIEQLGHVPYEEFRNGKTTENILNENGKSISCLLEMCDKIKSLELMRRWQSLCSLDNNAVAIVTNSNLAIAQMIIRKYLPHANIISPDGNEIAVDSSSASSVGSASSLSNNMHMNQKPSMQMCAEFIKHYTRQYGNDHGINIEFYDDVIENIKSANRHGWITHYRPNDICPS
jgi:hypothetical protein